MPTWLIHLCTAEKCERAIAPESIADYVVGALAPDCGKMLDFKVYEPTADITHWTPDGRKRNSGYDDFYHKMLCDKDLSASDSSFLMGYFVHLMTDSFWFRLFMQKYEDMYIKDPEDKRTLYEGMSKDLAEYERQKLQSEVCSYAELIKSIGRYSNSALDYLSDELLSDRVKGTSEYLAKLKNESEPYEMQYTSAHELDMAIDALCDEIIDYVSHVENDM